MVYKALGKSNFAFLLDLLEVNVNLEGHHFGGVYAVGPILEFGRLLSRYLINNPYLRQYDMTLEKRKRKSKRQNDGYVIIMLPTGEKFNGHRIIRSKSKYPFN